MHTYILALLLILVCLILPSELRRVTAEPHAFTHIFITEFVIDAIACEDNEVVLLGDLMDFNFWLGFDNIWVSTSVLQFCFGISESAAN